MNDSSNGIRLRLLGPAGATHPVSGPLVFRGRKTLALLARLALPPGTPHSRDRLAALLWPEMRDERARSNLRVTLARLNRALGASERTLLIADAQGITLDPDAPLRSDAHELERLLRRTDEHDHEHLADCAECRPRLERAVALYGGEFLDGFHLDGCEEFEEWQTSVRERLRGATIEALAALAEGHEMHGELDEAERRTRTELELDPLRETAHRRLMRVLTRQGRRPTAVAHYHDVRALLRDELGIEPDDDTTTLHQLIEVGEVAPDPHPTGTPSPSPHNLPAEKSAWIADEGVLDTLVEHQGAQRLLTLGGIGGIGKTRLALRLAREVLERFPDGVFLVRLASLQESGEIPSAVAAALGFQFEPGGDTTLQLLRHLEPRRALLVLDNFEHLIDGAALVGAMLDSAPALSIVVTSRQRLGLVDEAVWPVRGLGVECVTAPGSDEEVSSAASRLFLETARRTRLDFVPGREDLRHVARIGRLVDGHPLALVLAAGWLESLSCREIADELARGIELLETDLLDVPERQRSVQAAFEYSWALLDEDERATLAVLSVFRGGFDRHAAKAVANAPLRRLGRLLTRSLIEHHPARERYELHELMRQFAATRRDAAGQGDAVAERHAAYYLALLDETGPSLRGETLQATLARLERDIDNIRLAWLHTVGRGDMARLAGTVTTLRTLFVLAGRERDLVALLEPALPLVVREGAADADDDDIDRRAFELDLLLALGVAYRSTKGYVDPALGPLFERAQTLVADIEDSPELFAVLYGIWSFNVVGAHLDRAQSAVDEWRRRLAAAATRGDTSDYLEDARFIASCLEGPVRHLRGELVAAGELLEGAVALDRAERRDSIVAVYGLNFAVSARFWLAVNLCLRGRVDRALARAREARVIARASEQPLTLAFAAMTNAIVAVLRRDTDATLVHAREMQNLASEHRIGAISRQQGLLLEGFALAHGDPEAGIARMRGHLDAMGPIHDDLHHCLLVSVLLDEERHDEAASLLAHVGAFAEERGVKRFLAEYTRLEGELLSARGDAARAEGCFQEAIAAAHEQGARLLELRAACSLARLLVAGRRTAEALERLDAALAHVTEGADTPEVVDAIALRGTIASP